MHSTESLETCRSGRGADGSSPPQAISEDFRDPAPALDVPVSSFSCGCLVGVFRFRGIELSSSNRALSVSFFLIPLPHVRFEGSLLWQMDSEQN